MAGNNQFKERKSWISTQRQSLGPDWTARIHPDVLNKDIERVVKDLYFGNIGATDIQTNADFRDLCSYSIVTALYNYYGTKITNILPLYTIVQQWKEQRLNSVNSIAEQYRQTEIAKIQEELNNIPAMHFIDETYAYYYNAYSLLTGFINSNFSDFTFMDNLCRLVYKSNNRWGNPNSRFI
jgi:hypothetical protein